MRTWSTRRRIAWMILAGAVTLFSGLQLLRRDQALLQPSDIAPPGRWHLDSSRLRSASGEDDLARVLSLPYVAGSAPAPAAAGTRYYDPNLAFEGFNLYVSGHGPEARLIDMEGNLIHRWEYPFELAFPGREAPRGSEYFRRAVVYPDGDLLAIYQGSGMIRLDRDSRLRWRSELPYFNHLQVAPDGRIFSIAKQATHSEEIRGGQTILEDSIVILTPDGRVLERLSLLECFARSPYADLIEPLPAQADIFHTNTVQLVQAEPVSPAYPMRKGDLLVSLREVDIVAVLDPQARTIRQAWRGPWRAQHQPTLLPTHRILLFDNQGADGLARVLEFDPEEETIVWEYRGDHDRPLSSPQAGSCQRLPNGNTLITESERGRVLEIGPDSTLAWEFVSPHRAGSRGELVATLFEVVRLSRAELAFLDPGG